MCYFIFHESALNLNGGHQQYGFNEFKYEPELGRDNKKKMERIPVDKHFSPNLNNAAKYTGLY